MAEAKELATHRAGRNSQTGASTNSGLKESGWQRAGMGSSFGTTRGGVDVGATWCVRLHDGWLELAGVAGTLKLQTGSCSQAAFLLLTNCAVALGF